MRFTCFERRERERLCLREKLCLSERLCLRETLREGQALLRASAICLPPLPLLAAVFFLLAFLLMAAVACFSLWLLSHVCPSSPAFLLMAAVPLSRSAYAYITSRTWRAGPRLLRKD